MKKNQKYPPQKNAFVTGAAHGIGYQLAYIFARHNYNVVLVDKDEEKLAIIAK